MMCRVLVLVSVVVALLGVSVAQAAAASLATTDPVTAVTASDATVNGTLDANGGGTTVDCHFDYVDDATFQASAFDAPNQVGCNEGGAFDDGAQAVTGSLGGLSPNTLYHVRLVVSNATDTTNAAEETFTTATAAPVVDGSAAFGSAITTNAATLNATVNPQGSATTYHFNYGTTTGYGQSTPDADIGVGVGDVAVGANLAGLVAGTTYHFQVVADNGTGGEIVGADGTFTTAPAGAPFASAVTGTTATLNGTINPQGVAATYHFEYGTTTGYGTNSAEVDGGAGSVDIAVGRAVTGLKAGTLYHFRVVATVNGQTVSSDDATFITDPAPTVTLTAPTGLAVNAVTLHGTIDTHGVTGGGSYQFFIQSTTTAYASTTDPVVVPAGEGAVAVSVTVSDLPAGARFRVRLSATASRASTATEVVSFSTPANPPFVAGPPRPVENGPPYGCDCGPAPIAIYPVPSNAYNIKIAVKNTTATLSIGLPGPGSLSARGSGLTAKSLQVKKAGTVKLTVALSAAGRKALARARSHTLTRSVTVRFTPTGGTAKTITRTITFKHKAGR